MLLAILFFSVNLIFAQSEEFRKLENNAFKEGERLVFDLKYGFITAGIAVMEIPKIKTISGRDSYHITFNVNTTSAFDLVYKVRDRYESYVDVEGLFPWRFEQHIREGGYMRDFSAFFDHRTGKAKTSEGSYDIPKYVNDILSAFYLGRTLDYSDMKVGQKYSLQNFYKDNVYPLDIIYLGKETVDVSAGKFKCITVQPLISEGGLYKGNGNMVIYLTDDQYKMPVKVKAEVVIGSLDAELVTYSGLAGNSTAKI
ncbi:MAG: DUF3108 domain-containing protein [Ignavibacteriales bacterium]|nr:DUF3108 domain-containing protein [Ignavibacteriales bacterium]